MTLDTLTATESLRSLCVMDSALAGDAPPSHPAPRWQAAPRAHKHKRGKSLDDDDDDVSSSSMGPLLGGAGGRGLLQRPAPFEIDCGPLWSSHDRLMLVLESEQRSAQAY